MRPALPKFNVLTEVPAAHRIEARRQLQSEGVKHPRYEQIAARVLKLHPPVDPYVGLSGDERFEAEFADGRYDAAPDHEPHGFRSW